MMAMKKKAIEDEKRRQRELADQVFVDEQNRERTRILQELER